MNPRFLLRQALPQILANTLGMAIPYWQGVAKIAVLDGRA